MLQIRIKKLLKKNIQLGKINFKPLNFFLILLCFFCPILKANENLLGNFVDIKILDKVNSQNSTITLKIGEEKKFKNLLIKTLKCKNSEFDDNPEIIAYLQVKDITFKNKDKVFIFNDWTFASSPSIKPFDHPVYDIWLTKCYN